MKNETLHGMEITKEGWVINALHSAWPLYSKHLPCTLFLVYTFSILSPSLTISVLFVVYNYKLKLFTLLFTLFINGHVDRCHKHDFYHARVSAVLREIP